MTRRSWKALLLATMTVMLCVLIISGATFALFTDNVIFTNHLEAGKLDMVLNRKNLEWVSVDSNGYLHKHTLSDTLDLTTVASNTSNVFGLTGDSLIAPLSYYQATLEIENKGNVAFTYGVSFKLNGTSNKLAEQLQVTVKDSNNNVLLTKKMSEMSSSQSVAIKTVTEGTTQNLDNTVKTSEVFTVRVEFLDDGRPYAATYESFVNNEAMEKTVNFDLVVNAVQVTTIVTT